MNPTARKTVSVVVGILAALFLYTGITVPAFVATPYLLVGFALGVLAYFVWPRTRKA